APFLWSTLFGSHIGAMWCMSFGAGLLLAVGIEAVTAPKVARIGAGAALLLLAASRGAVSHAVEQGVISWAVGIDALHLLCAGAWVGVVIMASTSFARGRAHHTDADLAAAHRYLQALSRTATIALAGVLISGGYNLWRTLGALPARLDQPWLIWLTIKLALVVVAVALGAVNRWGLMPKLLAHGVQRDTQLPRQAQLLRILQTEAAVLVFTMATAAILSASAPPGVS
ncbi:MAG: CopD family protein, partial [Pseudomonadota bacterium]|nr:CopD family protein [Pseudomonadota bacterium]